MIVAKSRTFKILLPPPPLCKGKSVNALLSASTGEPDFSNVDDILQGERNLLPVDDLIVMNPTSRLPNEPISSSTEIIRDFFFFTNNKAVTELIEPEPILINQDCNTNGPSNGFPPVGFPYGIPSRQQTNAVRMFNLDRDVVVTYARDAPTECSFNTRNYVITIQDVLGEITFPETSIPRFGDPIKDYGFDKSVVGDFNLDGYEDILLITGPGEPSMRVVTAIDPDVPEMGVKFGSRRPLPTQRVGSNTVSVSSPMSSPVIGDFNGDTILDVAWVGSPAIVDFNGDRSYYYIYFASICPGSTENIPLCNGKSEFAIVLDPLSSQTIALNKATEVFQGRESRFFAYPASSLAAGDFNTNPDQSAGDDLIVVYGRRGREIGGFDIEYYTFNSLMTPVLNDFIEGEGKIFNVYAEAAQLDRTQAGDQAVMAVQAEGSCRLWVFTFDAGGMNRHVSDWVEGGSGTCSSIYQNPDRIALNGMTIGRFTDAIPSNAVDQDPQIAVYYSDYKTVGNGYNIRILEANPENNFIAEFVSSNGGTNSNLTSYFGSSNPNRGGSFLRAGDFQGRSLVLGAPSVARIPKFTQIDVIQGSPPMHGDYIQALNDSEPIVNNFSVIPETYNTAFSTETSSNTSSTESSTSSYTYSFMEGIEASARFPSVPVAGSFAIEGSFTAEQLYDCNVSKVNSEYSSETFGLQVVSGFGDQLIFTQQRQNIYYYPVIGQYICPDGTFDCNESEKEPLNIQFSAPDQIYRDRINEINAEFYQPVHEPGNIFSYAWTRDQLLARFGSVSSDLLTPSNPVGWFTDTSSTTEFTDWTQGSGNECTYETNETQSYNETLSVGFGNSFLSKIIGGKSVKLNFDFSQSTSNATMQSNISELSDSTGVSTVKTNSFLDPPNYQYRVQTYIFGEKFPEGVWDEPNPAGDQANIKSTGSLKVAFIVDPTALGSGNWWQSGPGANPYKAFPDIALNHPNKWQIVGQGIDTNQNPPSNCRPNTINDKTATCLLKRQPVSNPAQLWASGFYQMRGLIVQAGDEAIGPQRTSTVVGNDIHLTARLYNYSFKNFDPGTIIKAQFYRQQWDPTNVEPIGDSMLIEEISTPPVPAFNSGGTNAPPNWKTVSISFNTEQEGMQGDTWWIFWVLVWPQDMEGNLVAEVPGHGLPESTFIPGQNYKSIQDVPLEIVSILESGQEVQTSFTNNLGFLKQAFYVAPETISEELLTSAEVGEIVIENIKIGSNDIFVDDEILVEADVWSIGARADALAVTLNEGHPDDTDQVYDIELMSHILADSSNKFKVLYQPKLCGERDLYLSAGPEGPSAPTATLASIALNVICQPGDRNLDGQLIGQNGQPINMNSNCSIASPNTEIGPSAFGSLIVYILIPSLILIRRRLWIR